MTDPSATVLIAVAALLSAVALVVWLRRRRAAFAAVLSERGWQLSRSGDDTTVVPAAATWALTMTRSYAAQMSPPSTRLTVSKWRAPIPHTAGPVLVIGPAPPAEIRDLAESLINSATPRTARWLGMDRVTDGRRLITVRGTDDRLLVLSTDGYRPADMLTDVADAISTWTAVYRSDREQPAITVDNTGICVRVRVDVLGSLQQMDAFVALGQRCQAALRGSPA